MGFYRGPRLITDGLVLCLDAANTKSYPGSGTTCTDLSGNNNNGTLVNGVGYNTNNKGSFVFDGINDYISLNSVISNKPFTINFWCKLNSVKNQGFYISRTVLGEGIAIFAIGASNNSIRFDTGSVSIGQWNTSYTIPINIWVNITLLLSNTTKELYVNGAFNQSTNFTSEVINISPSLATIGASNVNGGTLDNYLNGNISNIMIYNRALTSNEILQNYNATKSRYGL